jgi:hypothetical protein
MRRTIVGPLNKQRARALLRVFESIERRLRRPSRTDLWLIAHLQTNEPSLEPLGPLAGKKVIHRVSPHRDQPRDCTN